MTALTRLLYGYGGFNVSLTPTFLFVNLLWLEQGGIYAVSQSSVIGDANAPFITSLAHTYAMAANYYGVTHPSEPNYIATISGSNWGVNDDQPTNIYDHLNIADQLEQHHLTWAAYMDSMPSVGFTGQQYPPTLRCT